MDGVVVLVARNHSKLDTSSSVSVPVSGRWQHLMCWEALKVVCM
jgi:hypothetical protein